MPSVPTFQLPAAKLAWGVLCLGLAIPGTPFALAQQAGQAAGAPALQDRPQTPAQSPSATISVTTREILLDVLVIDAQHHPVTGLKASDFTVSEEGEPQMLRHVEEHVPMTPEQVARLQSAPPLPPNTFTNLTPVANTNASTVILLDALDTPVSAQMYLREQLIAYLKEMQPGASIAIFQMDTEMRLIQGFTSDRQALLDAAKGKRDMPSLNKPFQGNSPEFRRFRRIMMRDGLQQMGRYLAGFPGRKNLLWFTGELPLTIFGTGVGNPFKDSFSVVGNDSSDDLTSATDMLTVSRVAIYPVDTRGLETPGQFDVARGGRPGRGSRFEGAHPVNNINLEAIAASTGGKAYYNTNGLKETIAQVVQEGSNYYTLAYSTTNQKWDGQYRNIKVTVNRPGVTLRHRQGYYAVNRDRQEQRQLAALEKQRSRSSQARQGAVDSSDKTQSSNAADAKPATTDEQTAAMEAGGKDAEAEGDGGADSGSGELIRHAAKNGFAAAMSLGAVAPTEVIFVARLSAEDKVEKLEKPQQPQDNALRPAYLGKPFRMYTVQLQAEARHIKVTPGVNGLHHGSVEFATVVYNQAGETVNSVLSTATFDLTDASYRKMLKSGLPVKQEIAVPEKGNYFLRLGVHDISSDQIGAMEIPVDRVTLSPAGKPASGSAI